MNPGLFVGIALSAAAVILVSCIAIGIFGYNPERARDIRRGEANDDPVVIEEVRRIHVGAPDRFRRGRVDRHWFYVMIHVGVLGYSGSILAGAKVTSNVATLGESTRFTMASCFLVGATLVLIGAMMGLHVRNWDIVPGVSDHIAAARLGDDIRLPYTFGGIGMVAIGISTFIYGETSFQSTWGSLGGWWTMCISFACVGMAVVFFRRIRQFSRALKAVVEEAVANVILRGPNVD